MHNLLLFASSVGRIFSSRECGFGVMSLKFFSMKHSSFSFCLAFSFKSLENSILLFLFKIFLSYNFYIL